jgi:hypothetical protein
LLLAVVRLSAASTAPQSPQNLLLGGFSTPHFGQVFPSCVPQFPQKFFPTGFSEPQFEQRMDLSENRTDISCIAHHGEKTH